MMRVSGRRDAVVAERLWRLAVLTAAGAIGVASQAEAAIYYWQDSDPAVSRPEPTVPQRRQRARHQRIKRPSLPQKETAKPQDR